MDIKELMPYSKVVKSILKKSIGPKGLKIWMLIVIVVVIAGSIGGYILLKPPTLMSTGQVASALRGSWNQAPPKEENATQAGIGLSGAVWAETSYYHNGTENLSVEIIKFINSNYADNGFTIGGFLLLGSLSLLGNGDSGNLNNAPYAYLNVPSSSGTASSGIIAQKSDFIIVIISDNFGMSQQQAKSLLSDQISDL